MTVILRYAPVAREVTSSESNITRNIVEIHYSRGTLRDTLQITRIASFLLKTKNKNILFFTHQKIYFYGCAVAPEPAAGVGRGVAVSSYIGLTLLTIEYNLEPRNNYIASVLLHNSGFSFILLLFILFVCWTVIRCERSYLHAIK